MITKFDVDEIIADSIDSTIGTAAMTQLRQTLNHVLCKLETGADLDTPVIVTGEEAAALLRIMDRYAATKHSSNKNERRSPITQREREKDDTTMESLSTPEL